MRSCAIAADDPTAKNVSVLRSALKPSRFSNTASTIASAACSMLEKSNVKRSCFKTVDNVVESREDLVSGGGNQHEAAIDPPDDPLENVGDAPPTTTPPTFHAPGIAGRKRIRIAEDPHEEIVVFHHVNPVDRLHMASPVDLAAVERDDDARLLRRRLQESKLSASRTMQPTNHQQAFSIFSLPVVVDTKMLSLRELQAELRVRGLRITGPKKQLVIRLDKYIMEHEKERCVDPE